MGNDKKCKFAHSVEGYMPRKEDLQYDGLTCDCGRILFFKELCNCPAKKQKYELKTKQNPNYGLK